MIQHKKSNRCTIFYLTHSTPQREIIARFLLMHSTSQRKIIAQFLFYPTPKMKIVARFPFLESATVALRNRVYDPDGQSVHTPLGSQTMQHPKNAQKSTTLVDDWSLLLQGRRPYIAAGNDSRPKKCSRSKIDCILGSD